MSFVLFTEENLLNVNFYSLMSRKKILSIVFLLEKEMESNRRNQAEVSSFNCIDIKWFCVLSVKCILMCVANWKIAMKTWTTNLFYSSRLQRKIAYCIEINFFFKNNEVCLNKNYSITLLYWLWNNNDDNPNSKNCIQRKCLQSFDTRETNKKRRYHLPPFISLFHGEQEEITRTTCDGRTKARNNLKTILVAHAKRSNAKEDKKGDWSVWTAWHKNH